MLVTRVEHVAGPGLDDDRQPVTLQQGPGPGRAAGQVGREGVEVGVVEGQGDAVVAEVGEERERIADVLELRRRLDSPDRLRLTIDVGHLRCSEDAEPAACILGAGDLVANVQIDDMRHGVHEHLPFGEGEVDVPPVLAALEAIEFAGLVAVELPRHSHAAPSLAASSLTFLRDAARRPQEVGR